jgi:hypothetical protein
VLEELVTAGWNQWRSHWVGFYVGRSGGQLQLWCGDGEE